MKTNVAKRHLAITLCILSIMFTSLQAQGLEFIDLSREITWNVVFDADGKGIHDCELSFYRVADMDKYASWKVNAPFDSYPVALHNPEGDEWTQLAFTLKGYVMADQVKPIFTGKTDQNGSLQVEPSDPLIPGLYLMIGKNVEQDGYIYTPKPAMVMLPGPMNDYSGWEYDVSSYVKWERTEIEPETCSLSVVKRWKDVPLEQWIPESVTVHLICGSEIYPGGEVVLSNENNWTYTWDELDATKEWSVIEEPVEGYHVMVTKENHLFVVTNTLATEKPIDDTVDFVAVKKINGDKPSSDREFTFILRSKDGAPMPEGSLDGMKTAVVTGEGKTSFGTVSYDEEGQFVYTVEEKQESVTGYTFDTTIYTVTVIVTKQGEKLNAKAVYVTDHDSMDDYALFTNRYDTPGQEIPNTGQLWWPVPLLVAAGAFFLFVGIVKRKKTAE